MTESEAQAICDDTTKRIDGDIAWKQAPDITYAVKFRVDVVCAVDPNIAIEGFYNRENKKIYFCLFRRSNGKAFLRLCIGIGHRNPSGEQAGDPHLHRWSDDKGDRIAGTVPFSTSGELADIWGEFCRAVNIFHEGVLLPPPPLQKVMLQ